jgi:hypothetical protein
MEDISLRYSGDHYNLPGPGPNPPGANIDVRHYRRCLHIASVAITRYRVSHATFPTMACPASNTLSPCPDIAATFPSVVLDI